MEVQNGNWEIEETSHGIQVRFSKYLGGATYQQGGMSVENREEAQDLFDTLKIFLTKG